MYTSAFLFQHNLNVLREWIPYFRVYGKRFDITLSLQIVVLFGIR